MDVETPPTDATAAEVGSGVVVNGALLDLIEGLFNGNNPVLDAFLRSEMDSESYVDVSLVANLKNVKQITADVAQVVAAMRASRELEVDGDGRRVRHRKCVDSDARGADQTAVASAAILAENAAMGHLTKTLPSSASSLSLGGAGSSRTRNRNRSASASTHQQQHQKQQPQNGMVKNRTTVVLRDVPSTTLPSAIQGLFDNTPLRNAVTDLHFGSGDSWLVVFDTEASAAAALDHVRSCSLAGRPVSAFIRGADSSLAASHSGGSRGVFYPGGGEARVSSSLPPQGFRGGRLNQSCNGSFNAGSHHHGASAGNQSNLGRNARDVQRRGNAPGLPASSSASSAGTWTKQQYSDTHTHQRDVSGRHSAGGYRNDNEAQRMHTSDKLNPGADVDLNATWPPPGMSPQKGTEGQKHSRRTGAAESRTEDVLRRGEEQSDSGRQSRPPSRPVQSSARPVTVADTPSHDTFTNSNAKPMPTTATIHKYSPEELLEIYAKMSLDQEPSSDFYNGEDDGSNCGTGSERDSPEPRSYAQEREAEHATHARTQKKTGTVEGASSSAGVVRGKDVDAGKPRMHKGSRSSSDLLSKSSNRTGVDVPPRPHSQQKMAPVHIVVSGADSAADEDGEDTDDFDGEARVGGGRLVSRPDSRESDSREEGDDEVGPDGKKKRRAGKSRSGSRRHRMKRKPSAAHMDAVKERLLKDQTALNARSPNSRQLSSGLSATFHSGLAATFHGGMAWPSREGATSIREELSGSDDAINKNKNGKSVGDALSGVTASSKDMHTKQGHTQHVPATSAAARGVGHPGRQMPVTGLELFKSAVDGSDPDIYDYDSASSDGGAYEAEDDRLNMTM